MLLLHCMSDEYIISYGFVEHRLNNPVVTGNDFQRHTGTSIPDQGKIKPRIPDSVT